MDYLKVPLDWSVALKGTLTKVFSRRAYCTKYNAANRIASR